ncbi:MAG: 4-oxalocrotonate tautomerase family protein [Campylobacteraceae bacterium]|nr:4-oxalocrotonate tautomerase family protein [Campylobacteraceae bacterium]
MPYINIKVTKENGEPTAEQKAKLIEGVTNLVSEILGRNKASTVVVIDEVEMDSYGLGGKSITKVRQEQAKLAKKETKQEKAKIAKKEKETKQEKSQKTPKQEKLNQIKKQEKLGSSESKNQKLKDKELKTKELIQDSKTKNRKTKITKEPKPKNIKTKKDKK